MKKKSVKRKPRINKTDGTIRNVKASHKRDDGLLARIKRLETRIKLSDAELRNYADGLYDLFLQVAKKLDERLDAIEKKGKKK
jgi:hypothetical protein